jgi:hypothetical protein
MGKPGDADKRLPEAHSQMRSDGLVRRGDFQLQVGVSQIDPGRPPGRAGRPVFCAEAESPAGLAPTFWLLFLFRALMGIGMLGGVLCLIV